MITLEEIRRIGCPVVEAAFLAQDLDALHKAIEHTLIPVPVGIWRALHRWADAIGGDVPNTFAMAAMLEAALAGDPLPTEPADIRTCLMDLDPRDVNSWWRLLFTTRLYTRRTTVFLTARLVEQRLGPSWATSLTSFDVTHWDIPLLSPAEASASDSGLPAVMPCWVTREPEICHRSWTTPVYAKSTT